MNKINQLTDSYLSVKVNVIEKLFLPSPRVLKIQGDNQKI